MKEVILFKCNGIQKVPYKDRTLIIDGEYATQDEGEIMKLRELKFREESLVKSKPKSKAKPKKSKAKSVK